MAKLRWTAQAIEDVEAICEFIAKDSLPYANLFAKDIFQVVKSLTKFSKSGRVVPELSDKNIREIVLGSYRVIYRIKGGIVEILTVYHSMRLLKLKAEEE